jgi:hypothetical protein
MVFRDSIEVHASAAEVFAFFEDMETVRYLGWHPDHKAFRWARGKGLKVGNQVYFEEKIAGKVLKKTVVLTSIDQGHTSSSPRRSG